jgi:hypothetical protein
VATAVICATILLIFFLKAFSKEISDSQSEDDEGNNFLNVH